MSLSESPEKRQESELASLKAIYGEDLKDLRSKSPWRKFVALNLLISLAPQQGESANQEAYAKVDLHVVCPEDYPDTVLKLSLENSRGLSEIALVELKSELEVTAEKNKGDEVIYPLCVQVQEFLHKHNKPPPKSFYDEMRQRKKEEEERDLQAKQIEEDRQRQFMLEEMQKRDEMLKLEYRSKREHRFNSENSNENENGGGRRTSGSNNSSENFEEGSCDHKESLLIEFNNRDIERGQCLKHCSDNHVEYTGIDTKTGELMVVSEWIFITKNNNDLNSVIKQLSSIEQELNYLTKLKHQNLSHYSSFKYDQDLDGRVVVYVLKEFVYGLNCSVLMKQNISNSVRFVRSIAKEVLTALDYLHRNNVVHKDLRETSVFLNDKGIVKLSNYSLHKRLSDLSTQANKDCSYSKKTDILRFGVFLLSILQSATMDDNVEIPRSIPADLYDFFTKCLCKDEKERFTASQLLNHNFFCTPPVHLSPPKLEEPVLGRNASPDMPQQELLLNTQPHGQSRINTEFEFIENLGRGAFGDVIKLRNKLDGGYYAIKRIKLNPKNRHMNKKIVREVTLLSRLNHENVVRYYNSWIETKTIKPKDSSKPETDPEKVQEEPQKVDRQDDFTLSDDIEKLAPPPINFEISITYDSKSQRGLVTNSSSDEESSDEEEEWKRYTEDSDSDGIEFEDVSNSESISEPSKSSLKTATPAPTPVVQQIDCMYIQMEFCERSTLRNAIDNHLHKDENRMWRMFREIVEGLAHIHQQGMIHRDLKPVNIFLDFGDHVKIGDFGLATTSIKPREGASSKNYVEVEDAADESKTGQVGTALYVAPELNVGSKAIYNQKVDIYSLGIIFFEMCYKPLSTNMERIKLLNGIRSKEILLPEDFSKPNSQQEYIIKWLLDHDISKRPTSEELLQSERLPPPVLEERELRELVRHTLSNPQLKGYKYLIASCFNQVSTPAQDITYDKDPSAATITKSLQLYDYVKQLTVKVFKQHGGQNLPTPLLMPKSQYYDNVESYVKLMTHFGGIVSLPHDLRLPFARYVAWNNVTYLRRFSIERVFREKKVFGFLPRELYECAFDIVTPTPGNLTTDAEILYMVHEIFNELPGMKNKKFSIRLNHASLLKAVLLHFGIKDKHEEMYKLISEFKDGKVPKHEMQTHLISFGLSDNSITSLIGVLGSEQEVSKAVNFLQLITKKKSGEASHLAKQALQDLKTIIHNADAFGVKFEIVIAPGMAYNASQYSGMIFQFVCELAKKHKQGNIEVLAAGGRYDSMIASYRNVMGDASILDKEKKQAAVGVSISLDKLVQAIQREQGADLPKIDVLDVAVSSMGTRSQFKEKTKLLKSLWEAGIKAVLIETTNSAEIQEQWTELKVPHLVILKDDGHAKVRSWERERFQEKSVKLAELAEYLQRIIRSSKEGSLDLVSYPVTKLESKCDRNEHEANVIFRFVEKLSSNTRKRHEQQIRSQLNNLFQRLTGYVTVFVLNMEANIVRTLASYLELESDHFQKSVISVIEKHPRHKKYLIELCDQICTEKRTKTNPTIVLYSLTSSFHKVIM